MPRRREPVRLRALADGTALLATSDGAGEHILVQFSGDRVDRRALPARGALLDAVIVPGGAAVLLESDSGVRRVDRDGTTVWEQTTDATRLLPAPDGRLLLAGPALGVIDLATGALGDTVRLGGDPFLAGNRIAFTSFDAEREQRLWVLHDLDTAHSDHIHADDGAWPFLGSPIGADAAGRAYGLAALELGRMSLAGAVDWRLPLAGGAVDDAGRVTVAGLAPDGTLVAVDGVRRLALPPHAAAGARLIARRPDGTLLLHDLDSGGLLAYGPDGTYQGDEAAPAEPLLAFEDLQTPGRDAVTTTGEVLCAIHAPQGLTVVSLAAPR
jgi:hypothetical protein